jgi:hypothetical protein
MRPLARAAMLGLALIASRAADTRPTGKVYRIGYLTSLPFPATTLANALRSVGLVARVNGRGPRAGASPASG